MNDLLNVENTLKAFDEGVAFITAEMEKDETEFEFKLGNESSFLKIRIEGSEDVVKGIKDAVGNYLDLSRSLIEPVVRLMNIAIPGTNKVNESLEKLKSLLNSK